VRPERRLCPAEGLLLEAMVLTAIGGVIGIALAEGISLAVDAFSPLPTRVSLFWVVLAFAALGMTLWVGWLIRDPAGLKVLCVLTARSRAMPWEPR
jgi:hypothetical protein